MLESRERTARGELGQGCSLRPGLGKRGRKSIHFGLPQLGDQLDAGEGRRRTGEVPQKVGSMRLHEPWGAGCSAPPSPASRCWVEPLARGEFPGKMGEVALWRCEGRRGRTAGTKDGCVREQVRSAAELTADGRKVVPVRRACRHPSPGQRT